MFPTVVSALWTCYLDAACDHLIHIYAFAIGSILTFLFGIALWKKASSLSTLMVPHSGKIDAKISTLDIETMAVSLLGFYFFVRTFPLVLPAFLFSEFSNHLFRLLFGLGLGLILMIKARHIVIELHKLRGEDQNQKKIMTFKEAQRIIILLFGIYIVTEFSPVVVSSFVQYFSLPESYVGLAGTLVIFSNLLYLSIGVFLIFGAQGVSNLISRLRTVGKK